MTLLQESSPVSFKEGSINEIIITFPKIEAMIIIIHHLIGNRKDTLERQRRMMRVNRENRITLKNPTFIGME
ncbi:hypothetical protein M8J75_006077 [Diaphorina citri]|nr:hypothetical protein M8J75_006077 [Diaphorina citri]